MKIRDKLLLKPGVFKPSFDGWKIDGIFNPGAIRKGKEIILYVRVAESSPGHLKMSKCPVIVGKGIKHENVGMRKFKTKEGNVIYFKNELCRLTNISHFREVILDKTGFNIKSIGESPVFTGIPGDGDYGVEDARITKIKRKYYMTYVSVNMNESVGTSLAVSKDMKKWKRKGIIFRLQNKDVVLFPEKINGKYVALHRPEGCFNFIKPAIWIAYSPNSIHWGEDKSIMRPREGFWDEERIGAGCPPIKTKQGWLCIYHGVNMKKGKTYSVGAFLLDLKDPEKILARTGHTPLLMPEKSYEKNGFMCKVVFPTGIVRDLNKKYLLLYCGGADSFISVKKIKIQDILDSMDYY